MISAMPAVAVRRERKKSKSNRGAPPSHHSSLASLSRGYRPSGFNASKRSTTHSVSTISSVPIRRPRDICEANKQRSRFLMYVGTVLLVAGLALLFIGVGASFSGTQTVGLIFIGLGCVCCLLKVCCTKSTTIPKTVKAGIIADTDGILTRDPTLLYNVPQSIASTPGSESLEFPPIHTHGRLPPISPIQDTHSGGSAGENNSNQTSSLTPTSLNSIPETQVLIPEDKERY